MAKDVIRWQLDLLVRLIDTTTGIEVEERRIKLFRNGTPLRAYRRAGGAVCLMNEGRENFLLRAEVNGYESCENFVDYEKLDDSLPIADMFLIPLENDFRMGEFITYQGKMPGLLAIEAVDLDRPVCSMTAYDERRKVMTVFLPNRRLDLSYAQFGLLRIEQDTYEPFTVERMLTETKFRLREPLHEKAPPNTPISRVIYGAVSADGSFHLRVRFGGEKARANYLVRYLMQGEGENTIETKFEAVDMKEYR